MAAHTVAAVPSSPIQGFFKVKPTGSCAIITFGAMIVLIVVQTYSIFIFIYLFYYLSTCVCFLSPETCRDAFLVSFILTQRLPTVDARPDVLIFITTPPLTRSAGPYLASKSSGFLVHQTIVCHMPSGKFPHFLVKFMKAAVCLSPPSNLYDPILLWWIACLMGTDRWGWK